MAHCDVDLLFKEKGGGLLELGLKNNMDKTYEIRYDRLPWVLAGGGVDFNVLIDGEKVRKGVGAGQNNVILRINLQAFDFRYFSKTEELNKTAMVVTAAL